MRIVALEPAENLGEVADALGLTIDIIDSVSEINEPTWVLPAGHVPAVGAYEAIVGWLEEDSEHVLYGDTSYPELGRLHRRPRFSDMTLASTWDVASLVLPTGTTAESWDELVAESLPHMAHIPVTLDSAPGPLPLHTPDGWVKVGRANAPTPIHKPVSIIIPSIGSPIEVDGQVEPALHRCLVSLPEVDEIVIVAGPAMESDVLERAREIAPGHVTVVHIDGEFNFSASCNLGAASARNDLFLFLNDDVEAGGDDWLGTMIAANEITGGPVGIRLLFPDGRIQHAGIVINPESMEPNHLYYKMNPAEVTDPVAHACAHFLAVTGAALLVSRDSFEQVGGFCEDLPSNYNDVDLCLKLAHIGLGATCINTHSLIHRESTSRVPTLTEKEAGWMEQWRGLGASDPYTYAWS